MKEKDIAEKTLESYNDVFADIVNVLLFDGRELVREDDLVDGSPLSQYKADGKLHEQERDVSKFWKSGNIRICLYGLENQTAIDVDMPLRVLCYDGAAYRAQLLADKKGEVNARYPVVTLVLYFGEERWKKRSLLECVKVPEELKTYVNDYKVNVFEIARLEPETVGKFKSDFRIVADYFVQQYRNKDYVPSAEVIRHVHETLELMAVLTQDRLFEDAQDRIVKEDGGFKMTGFLERAIEKGISIGRSEGISIGRSEGASAVMSLFARLRASGRSDDMDRAITDREYLQKLLDEFQEP